MRIPGLAGATGGEIMVSEAAMPWTSAPLLGAGVGCGGVEVGAVAVTVALGDLAGSSEVMVDWEEEREKVLARGARWVSLSSELD